MWKNSAFVIPLAFVVVVLYMTVPSAHAEPFQETIKGKDYDNKFVGLNPDGHRIYNWAAKPERILHNGEYTDYILTESPAEIKLETANSGSVVFNKSSCSYDFYKSGYVDELNQPTVRGISWTVKGKLSSATTWSNVNTVNSAACNVSIQTTESTVRIIGEKASVSGTFQIVLDYVPGKGIKETMRAYNNNPAWNNHHIGFTETFEVPRLVLFGNKTYDLANYNGTTLGRNWIENNKAKIVHFNDGLFYDLGIGFANLDDIKISWDGVKAKLSMNYLYTNNIVPYQQWFEVDPTFSVSGTSSGRISTTSTNQAFCSQVYSSNTANFFGYQPLEGTNDLCQYAVTQFNIASLAGQTIAVTSAFIEIDVDVEDNTKDCQVRRLSTDLSTINQQDLTDAQGGTVLVSSDSDCNTTGNNKALNFGTNRTDIATAVKNSVTNYAVALSCPPAWDRPSSGGRCNFEFSDPSLNFTYVTSGPATPLTLSATSNARQVQYTWTVSSGSGVTTYYIGRSLDNSTWPSANKTNTGNVTSYTDSAYYRPGLLYYVNVTAYNGFNSTAKYTSFTMDGYPSAPRNPYKTNMNATWTKINWQVPSSNGNDSITGYRVERATGYTCGGSFTILTNLTTSLNYNNTGLSATQQYCYRIAAWNGVGLGPYSSNVLRFTLPSAVTDLSITNVGTNSVDLEWTQPTLGEGTLSGYMVNFTSPHGTPTTKITNNTLSAITSYTVNGLTGGTDYSFRIGIWTTAGFNGSGNIADTTTFALANFTIGTFNLNTTNPEVTPIRFLRTDISDTATQVKVIYPNLANMTCVLDYQFAQQSDTYSNLAGSPYSTNFMANDFLMNGSNNDIIAFDCTDIETNNTATYVLQQTDFALKEQVENFRNGTYGTMGMIGYIDLVTLVIFIFVMIGFNRINPSVGAIMSIAMLGAIAYFEIISIPGAIFGAIAVVVMLIIGSTRKDD